MHGTSLMVQWLRIYLPSNVGDVALIPGRGTKIPDATGQPSPCPAAREDCVWQLEKRAHHKEKPFCYNEDPAQSKTHTYKDVDMDGVSTVFFPGFQHLLSINV